MKSNSQIRREARKNLSGFTYEGQPISGSYPESMWGTFVLMTFLYMIISGIAQSPCNVADYLLQLDADSGVAFPLYLCGIALILLVLPMGWGYVVSFLNHRRGVHVDIDQLFMGYKQFGRIFVAYLLNSLYVLLWTLLLIIPGIVKSLSYSLMPFILADNPGMSGEQAICRSMEMMQGNKFRLFLLILSFIWWAILAILTCGIGFLWLYPYVYASLAAFYDDVKADFEKKDVTAEA